MKQALEPTNVLLVCSKFPPEYAGSGLRAHRTYSRLKEKYGVHLQVICSSMTHTAWKSHTYRIDGVSVTRISSPFKRRLVKAAQRKQIIRKTFWYLLCGIDESFRTWLALRRLAKPITRVHTFGHCWSAGIAAIWAGHHKIPILRELVTMQSRPDDPPGLRFLVRRALKKYGTIIAISPLLESRARALGYARIWCRPNPVDEKRFRIERHSRNRLRAGYTPFKESDTVLMDLSKYSQLKNKDLLIRMMPLLPEDYKLVLAGPLEQSDDAIREYLENLVYVLELENRVILINGFIDEPQEYFQLADVFLFPSLSDGLGTPVLEAVCCGVPAVVNRLPGVTDWWIREGYSGAICSATPRDFAEGVRRAARISPSRIEAAAKNLSTAAGTEAIDAQYYKYLSEVCIS